MNQTTEPFIQIRNLHKSYGDLKVLRGINLEIPPGEMVSVIGPSGSGKSTLLRVLMTLERPERGGVRVGASLCTMSTRKGRQSCRPRTGFALCGTGSAWYSSISTCFRTSVSCAM